MSVVFLSYDDYANLAYDQAESMKRIGIEAESYKLVPHVFNYEKQSAVVTDAEMTEISRRADVIVIMHTNMKVANMVRNMRGKKVVYHTGSEYRARPEYFNAEFNQFVDLTLTDQCEFMALGADNIVYNAATIDVSSAPKFGHQVKRPYKIAHYPSNPEVKGTSEIKEMMKMVGLSNLSDSIFTCSDQRVSHSQQLVRMDQCDIYVELFKPELRGKPYGCFGVTAFEAAAAGKIVVTNNIHEKVYEDAYGECMLQIANTKEKFVELMNIIVGMESDAISAYQTKTYNWIKNNHSYEANGLRLKKLFEI